MKPNPITVTFWKYDLGDGWEAWAGKTEVDNDLVSFRLAHPEDFWFHINGLPGSHVILKFTGDTEDKPEPTRQLKDAAAAIAAYHSKARNAGNVAVTCTKAKFVSKPKGAKPGSVQVRQTNNLKAKPAIPKPPTDAKIILEYD
jgi:predicted ribosome quality control (RQC) complex YloA/Tae2 family protein